MKMAVFWVVAPCSLMMEAASTSETSVNFYQTTRRSIPETTIYILVSVLFIFARKIIKYVSV
jgi:hypothetical protein